MKSLSHNTRSLYWKTIIAGLVLTVTTLGIESIPLPSLAHSQDQITEKIVALKSSQNRWIEINLTTQRLIAWEGEKPVYAVIVSTGKKETPTLTGVFNIQIKRPLDRMIGPDYDVPNVPHAMYYDRGYAIHGAYWHNNFGTPVSHGCTNVAVDHAEWLYNWASVGTPVVIHR
ncbi:ErfK/YbiS/YcfS/YnhG family protein [Gloeothece citriformis PCC 7424]|uniref:ErfK/YbiS/YcfS/YnhG family protein n=1 Tax=Gloeothece citriformis (strain PCC 7424) TaxID=65393 RepID=B7K7Z0_GLOC7|nr:L,D-transpeptidase [Gloeothece citriformis]ACK68478.1 ErfK/YbiS/YcfS/YnhG family protein [Gloeothece citriformis PCC 7424]